MGESKRPVDCPWCRESHGRRFLCDAAAAILGDSMQRGRSGTLPAIEMDQPLPMTPDPDADVIVAQLVVKAGMVPGPGGVIHPVLVFTGLDADRRVLPQWVYLAGNEELRAAAPLVQEMAELAIRRADQQNRAGRAR